MLIKSDLHFLVANDQATMRTVLVALLKELGYVKVSEAVDGEMALRSFKSAKLVGAPIHFVISDWYMPVMDGLTFLKSIRNDDDLNGVPVLIVTAEATREIILAAAEAGADDYIVRPFKSSTLKKKIDKILEKKPVFVDYF